MNHAEQNDPPPGPWNMCILGFSGAGMRFSSGWKVNKKDKVAENAQKGKDCVHGGKKREMVEYYQPSED